MTSRGEAGAFGCVRHTALVQHEPVYVSIAECDAVYGTAVVIDVYRAYTTAAWALHLGAERMVLSDDVDEALRIRAAIPGAMALKDSKPLEGFELSNSPVEMQSVEALRGKTLGGRAGDRIAGRPHPRVAR